MPIPVSCDGCGKNINVPDQYAGKSGKCPAFGARIVVPSATTAEPPSAMIVKARPTAAAPMAPAPTDLLTDRAVTPSPRRDLVEYKACMFCGESILVNAIKCKHCGEMLNQGYPQPAVIAPPVYVPPPPPQYLPPPPAPIVQVPVNIAQHTHVVHQTRVVVQKAPFNHFLHFVLTVLTCGAWFPFWIIMWLLH